MTGTGDMRITAARAALAECPSAEEMDSPLFWVGRLRDTVEALLSAWPPASADRGSQGPGPGPFETERQVRELPAVRAVYEAFDADPGVGRMAPHNERMLRESCAAAGVALGAFDVRIVSWLAGWEPETCAVIAGLISRAYAAGCRGQAAGAQARGADLAGNSGLSAAKVATVLAALADATELICEQAAWCWECAVAPAVLCGVHEESLAHAEDYDRLAGWLRGQR
jgi:hypothetical protein